MKKLIPIASLYFFVLYACDKVYFTEPQPVLVKNVYEFPSSFRGQWVIGNDTTTVTNKHFKRVEYSERSMSKKELDTSGFFVMYKNKLYIKDTTSEISLKGGYPYFIKNDSIFYTYRELIKVDLGGDAFLRKSGNNYILNVNREEIWWELFLIQRHENGEVLAKSLNPDDMALFESSETIYEDEHDHFVDAKMSKDQMNRLISKGGFSDTVYQLTAENKIK